MARVIVCGSREWTDHELIYQRLLELDPDDVVITGGAKGADTIAHGVAWELGMDTEVYPARWDLYGVDAGKKRNEQMLASGCDLVIAFPSETSRGTWHMVAIAKKAKVAVEIVHPRQYSGGTTPDLEGSP